MLTRSDSYRKTKVLRLGRDAGALDRINGRRMLREPREQTK
jgi:hypothetical protein